MTNQVLLPLLLSFCVVFVHTCPASARLSFGLLVLVAQEEVEDVLSQRLCDELGPLHGLDGLVEAAREWMHSKRTALRRGQ